MTERSGLAPVEPLSERRWSEIEARLLERVAGDRPGAAPPPAARRPVLLTASTIALAAAAIAALVLRGAQEPAPPALDLHLASSRVMTEGARARTTAGDASVDVAPRSSVLVLERERDAWVVVIEHGSARFSVPPRHERPAFVVEAGEVRVEVIGTRFEVARAPGATAATVSVDEGTVRVTSRGEEVFVHAGETWLAGGAPSADDTRGGPITEPVVEAVPVEPAGELAIAGDAPPRARPRVPRATGEVAAPAPVVEPAPAEPTPRERFLRAQSLESSDPVAASTEYEILARGEGAWAANALYAQARLAVERGRRDEARVLLERYLGRFPEGVNAEDGRRLLDGLR